MVSYVGLGVLLAGSAITLLIKCGLFMRSVAAGSFTANRIDLLDTILLIVLIVELPDTVEVSFREHAIAPEPFLVVGLIAAI